MIVNILSGLPVIFRQEAFWLHLNYPSILCYIPQLNACTCQLQIFLDL